MVIPDEDNSEVVDDWPLHKTNKVHNTKLIVGACWEGSYIYLYLFFFFNFKDYFVLDALQYHKLNALLLHTTILTLSNSMIL